MAAIDLSPYKSVQQATFVKLVLTVDDVEQIIRFSSHQYPFAITEFDGVSYTYPCVGSLLSVTAADSQIKATQADVTVTVTGIPKTGMPDLLYDTIENPIQGSPIEIRRAFFNPSTGQVLAIPGNPVVEFTGVVSQFSTASDWDENGQMAVTSNIVLVCQSMMSVLNSKVAGRRTNQSDQTYWFPGDNSMNRVSVIALSNFDFGGGTPNAAAQSVAGRTITVTT